MDISEQQPNPRLAHKNSTLLLQAANTICSHIPNAFLCEKDLNLENSNYPMRGLRAALDLSRLAHQSQGCPQFFPTQPTSYPQVFKLALTPQPHYLVAHAQFTPRYSYYLQDFDLSATSYDWVNRQVFAQPLINILTPITQPGIDGSEFRGVGANGGKNTDQEQMQIFSNHNI